MILIALNKPDENLNESELVAMPGRTIGNVLVEFVCIQVFCLITYNFASPHIRRRKYF